MQNVAELADITTDRATEVEIGEHTLILVRDGEAVRAYAGKCPHAGAPLAKGAVCDGTIVCPWHKAVFSVADGALLEPPALHGLQQYRTEIRDGAVFVDPAQPLQRPPAPPAADGHVLLVGAGAAGAACAAGLREFGFRGTVTMVAPEADAPYDRTALSKFVLEGGKAPDEVEPLLPEEFYAEHGIERVHARVTRLDPVNRIAVLEDSNRIGFSHALIATGGAPKHVDLPGAKLRGVFTLRSKADAAAITDRAKPGGRAVILGSSFIGLESASALRKRGMDVTVVAPEAIPFAKQFGERIGTMFRDLHVRNGVVFRAEAKAARLTGDTDVSGVVLENGEELPADLVLVGVGVGPVTGFLDGLGLGEDGGIPVDAGMRAAPGLYAAGDVASFPFGDGTARIEHWRVAQQQARIAASNIAGHDARYGGVPFFWTYHFGKRFEYLGHATKWDDVVVEGSLDEQDFVALLVDRGRVAGILACQRERATCLLLHRMRSGVGANEALAVIRAA